jgi:hypothetical protein
MNKFIILYSKAEEAKGKTMDDWMAWFKSIGERVLLIAVIHLNPALKFLLPELKNCRWMTVS